MSEPGGGPTRPGPTSAGTSAPAPTAPGWYDDPAGRFEFRYHNGSVWTPDVASNGQRYIDPVTSSGGPPVPHALPPATAQHLVPGGRGRGDETGNGIAVAALVCGIVSLALGWIPVVFAIGAVLAVLAIIFGIVGIRRSRTRGRRGMAVTGLITGSIGVLVAIGGLVFTIVVVRAIDRYEHPPESTTSIDSCVVSDGRARAEGELRNDGTRTSRYTVYVEFRGLPSGPTIETSVEIASTAPGSTAQFAVEQRLATDDVECEITAVNGPLPFGLEID